jgi:hypothetical protein
MFTSVTSAGARIAGLAIVLVAAAAIGLAAGNLINSAAERESRTNAGYPVGWNGGGRIPVSQTATAGFSQSALDAVRITRGDAVSAEAPTESDYHDRHPQLRPDAEESDYHQRHTPASNDDATPAQHRSGHPQLE